MVAGTGNRGCGCDCGCVWRNLVFAGRERGVKLQGDFSDTYMGTFVINGTNKERGLAANPRLSDAQLVVIEML
jgi:hypothetical protein